MTAAPVISPRITGVSASTRTCRENGTPGSEQAETISGKLRALLVEDEPADAELALRELGNAGFDVHADVVQEAEDFAEHMRKGNYDVIITD
jgi:hypothetical protein